MSRCQWCGNQCNNDFIILDIKSIKDGDLYIPSLGSPIVLCWDCYEKLRESINNLNS